MRHRKGLVLIFAHQMDSSHPKTDLWHIEPTGGHLLQPYNHHHKFISYKLQLDCLKLNLSLLNTI